MARKCFYILALCLMVYTTIPEALSKAQAELPRKPISALWSDGTRLLIGQGGMLSEVAPSADSLLIRWQIGLGRGTLQAIAVCAPFTFALSADGLSVLDAQRRERAFARGGGHRLACNADQVWVAALGAGVRRYQVAADGKLTPLAQIQTAGHAHDIVPSGSAAFWIAEGEAGVRRYGLDGTALLWLNAFVPAQVVRESGNRLFIGHGAQLSVVALGELPQMLGGATLVPDEATIADVLVVGARVYVGRHHGSGRGAALIAFELTAGGLRLIAQFGETGDGATLGAVGDELFLIGAGSLTWLRLSQGALTAIMAWSATAPHCALNTPTDPQPEDGAQVRPGRLLLQWRASCADSFELWLDGALFAEVTPAVETETERPWHSYAVELREGTRAWQVVALDSSGARLAGPIWRVIVTSEGLLSTPDVPRQAPLYQPPFAARSLAESLLLLGAALCGGLSIIILAAWWLGVRAQRRTW
ncbi:MAG: hypothetical protein CUN49_08390 [Candidatus Thermofonsia Clade 1 bacterium]|uniref:Fibronectin type-III domain-containing protein n=1 Tax=Candidatus Thermofonsia Clade 1 bacterium TaxID=2364210 RepID=A0A2M8PED1_9CHLR|nr:MAG: hypothetical protein CUN49_08390 [Candidatus Thermofonsia Clade 1 bacterium]